MSLLYTDLPASPPPQRPLRQFLRVAVALSIAALACRDGNPVTPPNLLQIAAIAVNAPATAIEIGSRDTLTATALDSNGDTLDVPVVWRSSNERVARFERGGVFVALDTGITAVSASSLGVESGPVPFLVVWFGPAAIDSGTFSPPNARGPGVALTDSVRVIVTNKDGIPVANARVEFTITEGGGSVSPATDSTDNSGIAASQWTLGPAAGQNRVTASVIRSDGTLDTLVSDNLVTFTINSYNALTFQSGDNQTAQILANLPQQPSVKLVDSLGAPRAGVPVTFTVFANGRVASPVVPTDAAGIASPGTWTLGDIPGQQRLEARVEDAKATLLATATGTPIFYKPVTVSAGGFATCALESGGVVKCWGSVSQIGTGDVTDIFTPTAVKGTLVATALASGPSHSCALTASGQTWCWGVNAYVDTSGSTTFAAEPTRLQSDIVWAKVSPGATHNCGVDLLENAYCWGANGDAGVNAGQLGDGTTTTRFVPTSVTGGFKFSHVAGGNGHSCALSNGAAFCWGQNGAGQLGDGSTQARLTPTAVGGGLTFESIGVGEGISCGLTPQPEGKAYCWGGISGFAQTTATTYPGAPAFTSLSVGSGHACALAADASAYCWGLNNFGQVGDSTAGNRRTSPTKVAGDLRFAKISAGFLHTCGITTDGAVACWGDNRAGALGDTTAAFRSTPRHVVLGVNP